MVNRGVKPFWTPAMRKTLRSLYQWRRNYTDNQKAAIFYEMFKDEMPAKYRNAGAYPADAMRTQYVPHMRRGARNAWAGITFLKGMSDAEKAALQVELDNICVEIDRVAGQLGIPVAAPTQPDQPENDDEDDNEQPQPVPQILDARLAYPYTHRDEPDDLGYDDQKKIISSRRFGKKINDLVQPHERRRYHNLPASDYMFDFNFNDPDWIAMAFTCKRTVAGNYTPGVYKSIEEIAEDIKEDGGYQELRGEMLKMLYERRLEYRQHDFLFDLMAAVEELVVDVPMQIARENAEEQIEEEDFEEDELEQVMTEV